MAMARRTSSQTGGSLSSQRAAHSQPVRAVQGGGRTAAPWPGPGHAACNRPRPICQALPRPAPALVPQARPSGEPIAEGNEEGEEDYAMTPEELEQRLANLLHTCTYTVGRAGPQRPSPGPQHRGTARLPVHPLAAPPATLPPVPTSPAPQVFNYTRRGLFDRDKLIVLTLLTFNIGAPPCARRAAMLLPAGAEQALSARTPHHPTGLRQGSIDAAEYEVLCKGARRWGWPGGGGSPRLAVGAGGSHWQPPSVFCDGRGGANPALFPQTPLHAARRRRPSQTSCAAG
jgi:hypothetical protein